MVELSELPDDIVARFLQLLPGVEDHARFPAVCKVWRSVSVYEKRTKPFGPWLMLATLDNDKQDGEEGGVRICYSFHSSNLFRLSLPELQGRRCWGTPHGWLLTLGLDLQIALFHPFARTTIPLPQPNFQCNETEYTDNHHVCQALITNVALSSNPSGSRSVVTMVAYGGNRQLSFAHPGDESWTHVKTPRGGISDIIFFAGRFYCMDGWGRLYVCDIKDTLQPSAYCIASRPKGFTHRHGNTNLYLVEISGRLYLIIRNWRPCEEPGEDAQDVSTLHIETRGFIAYEFDFRNQKWMDNVKDFDGHAVFLGNSTTCAISALDHPELNANCIYFTDDQYHLYASQEGHYNDMGVYNFHEKTMMKPFYKITQWASKFSRPFFFTPTLK